MIAKPQHPFSVYVKEVVEGATLPDMERVISTVELIGTSPEVEQAFIYLLQYMRSVRHGLTKNPAEASFKRSMDNGITQLVQALKTAQKSSDAAQDVRIDHIIEEGFKHTARRRMKESELDAAVLNRMAGKQLRRTA